MALPQIRAQTRRRKVRSPAAQGGNQLLFPLQELPGALSPPVGREVLTSRRNPPSGGSAQCSCAPCSFWGQLPPQLLAVAALVTQDFGFPRHANEGLRGGGGSWREKKQSCALTSELTRGFGRTSTPSRGPANQTSPESSSRSRARSDPRALPLPGSSSSSSFAMLISNL